MNFIRSRENTPYLVICTGACSPDPAKNRNLRCQVYKKPPYKCEIDIFGDTKKGWKNPPVYSNGCMPLYSFLCLTEFNEHKKLKCVNLSTKGNQA